MRTMQIIIFVLLVALAVVEILFWAGYLKPWSF